MNDVCLSESAMANSIAGRFAARSHGETTGHSQFVIIQVTLEPAIRSSLDSCLHSASLDHMSNTTPHRISPLIIFDADAVEEQPRSLRLGRTRPELLPEQDGSDRFRQAEESTWEKSYSVPKIKPNDADDLRIELLYSRASSHDCISPY
jgi:hypothetical protein